MASHLFVPTGDSGSIEGLGQFLEVIHFTEPPSISIRGTNFTATSGGISCLRFRYRTKDDDNTIQTLCVVSFDETGNCGGLQPLTFDLEQFLGSDQGPAGNSNLLEAGDGLFYATCLSSTGKYRLQQPAERLPTLYFTMVDALGDGQYSLGDPELSRQRQGVVTTFSGAELRPPWIASVSREIQWLRLNDGLGVEFNDEDCSVTPSCTYSPELVQPGDILRIGVGLDGALIEAVYARTTPETLDQFFRDRIGIKLEEFAVVHPDAARRAFERLVGLDVMDQLVHYFGELYMVREKGVVVGYGRTHYPLPYPYACFPDQIATGEMQRCQRIEQAVQGQEALRIGTWQDEGYNVWLAGYINYWGEGEPAPFADLRPHFSLFNGVIAGIGANSDVEVSDVGESLAQAIRHFSQDVGPDTPVVLTLNGPPITAQTGGGFCEADICTSDFKGMYDQTEAVLNAALRYISVEQFNGFGVATFEGAHFDIRQPYERYSHFALNRVGETGYNNPVLNIYRAGLISTPSLRPTSSPPGGLSLPFRTQDVGGSNEFISPFGIIRHSRDAGHGHGGIDFPLNENAPVYAVADGTILSAEEYSDGAGAFDVKLLISGSGGEGWGFLYEHIELESGIDVGSTVTIGQLIGRNGLITTDRNNHLQLTYMFNDYKFYSDQRCWVDHLDSASKKTLLDYFDSIKTEEEFVSRWQSASEEGMKAYSELLNKERFPEGPQLCYPLGLDVRLPE